MRQIPMIALEDFEFDGVSYSTHQRFEVPPVYASIFRRKQHARFVTDSDAVSLDLPPMRPPAVVEPPVTHTQALNTKPRRKPRKNRRDIVRAPRTKALSGPDEA